MRKPTGTSRRAVPAGYVAYQGVREQRVSAARDDQSLAALSLSQLEASGSGLAGLAVDVAFSFGEVFEEESGLEDWDAIGEIEQVLVAAYEDRLPRCGERD